MAMDVELSIVGVDVSKRSLDICIDQSEPVRIDNDRRSIARWLKSLSGRPVALAVEPTNTFHRRLCDLAHEAGHTLYLIDGYRLSRYRDSLGVRAKTDANDARVLQRYLAHEQARLRPWSPPPKGYSELQRLLGRRAAVVQAQVRLRQSLAEVPELKRASASLFAHIARIDRLIQQLITKTLQQVHWAAAATGLRDIEGIGPLTSAALTMAYHRGRFRSSDAFIAFLGLDVRVSQSGLKKGRGRLTKKGPSELRRLLFLAAMRASSTPTWSEYYQRYLQRGLAKIQALNILARKLARVAFALLRSGHSYQPLHAKIGSAMT